METTARPATHTVVTRGLEQVVDIETPEQVVFSYTIAGIGSRAAAALFDQALIIGSLIALGLLYAYVIAPAFGIGSGSSVLARKTGAWAIAILLLLQFVAQWGYYVLFEALWDGQTPGKRWLHLRVVQDGGYSVSFAASAARNIARVLDMQPGIVYLVGLVAVAVSKTGKRTGDQLAGTFVVRESIVESGGDRAVDGASGDGVADRTPAAGGRDAGVAVASRLSEEELDLLRRFVDRSATLAQPSRDVLAEQLAAKFGAHLPDAITPTAALAQLLREETAARESGVAARGETGAARERYAMVAEGTPRWTRFAQRLARAQRTGLARMSPDEVASFVADYREIATDLARLSTASRGRGMDEVFRLSRLVAGGHNLLYRQERLAMRGIARFLFVTVPAELRRSIAPIAAAAVLFFGSGIASYLAVVRNPALAEELVAPGMIDRAEIDAARARTGQATYIDVEDYARPIVASAVFRNNVQVTFMAFASGLTAGVITVLLLVMNGMSIGSAIGLFQTKGVAALILDFVVAHSVFELSAICIAAGGGFLIAGAMLLPGARTRREALVVDGRRALRLLAAASFLLFFAGGIEGLISPRSDLGFAFKGAVAIASGLLIAAYASLGRGASADESREVTAYSAARALTAR